MGFIYLNKFTYLNTFMIKLAHKCSDNGGPTVTANALLKMVPICAGLQPTPIGTLTVHLLLTLLGLWAHWSHGWHCDGPPPDRSTFVVPCRFGGTGDIYSSVDTPERTGGWSISDMVLQCLHI